MGYSESVLREKHQQVMDQLRTSLAESIGIAFARNDKEASFVALGNTVVADACLQAKTFDKSYEASDNSIQFLEEHLGPYQSWSTDQRSLHGFSLAFYYYQNASALFSQGSKDKAGEMLTRALEIKECRGNLLDLAMNLQEWCSSSGQMLRRLIDESNQAFRAKDYARAISVCTQGIELIEREQATKRDWAGNDLAQFCATRGRSYFITAAPSKNKQLLKQALDDLDRVLSFPSSYFITPGFREEVLEHRNVVKQAASESKCFIATAAYGSAFAPDVVALRRFRDTRLKQNWLGHWVIRIYEQWSPPLADAIASHPTVRLWVRRLVLSPVVWLVRRWTS
jgi:tetratricopeptide (TPR) repeat protein